MSVPQSTPRRSWLTTRSRARWIADRVTAFPEVWDIIALHLGLVGAWRLMLVCKAARVGAKDFLKTLPLLFGKWGNNFVGLIWSRYGGLI